MSNKQEPNWQPIKNLPIIARMIDGQTAEAQNQYSLLLEAHCKPYVLDDATIQRTIKVFSGQQEFICIYEQQLSKWQNEEKPASAQKSEITRLQGQVVQWKKTVADILSLADELKTGTIEKVMRVI